MEIIKAYLNRFDSGEYRPASLLDLTADFEVKTNAKLTPISMLRREEQNWYPKLSVHSNHPNVYPLIYNFSD